MSTIRVEEIRDDLLGSLRRVQSGGTLIVTQGDEAIAEIRPITPRARRPRPSGLCAGEFTVPDDFDDPLPEGVLRLFEAP